MRDDQRLRRLATLLMGILLCLSSNLRAQPSASWSALNQEIKLAGDKQSTLNDGRYDYYLFEGDAYAEQGINTIRASTMLAWVERDPNTKHARVHVTAFGNVRIAGLLGGKTTRDDFQHTFETARPFSVRPSKGQARPVDSHPLFIEARQIQSRDGVLPAVASIDSEKPASDAIVPAVAQQPTQPREPMIQQVQVVGDPLQPGVGPINEVRPTPRARDAGAPVPPRSLVGPSMSEGGARRIRWFPRTSQPFNASSSMTPAGERQFTFTGGINIIVEDIATGIIVDIVADRAVLWTSGALAGDPVAGGVETTGGQRVDLYLEGNVNIRQGNPTKVNDSTSVVLYGKQVYFDANTNQALVLDGAVEAFDSRFSVPIYMTSSEIRQIEPGRYAAREASFTTSVHRGTPGYAFTGSEFYFEEIRQRIRNPFTGQDVIDSATGQPLEVSRHYGTGYNNVLRIGDVPVFYWPYLRANAEDPLGPVQDLRIGQSNILGTFGSVGLDIWQLTGLDYLPVAKNTNWLLDLGYFSKRGPMVGSRFNYLGSGLLSNQDTYWGNSMLWYLRDDGLDTLSLSRRNLTPDRMNRNRSLFQHRHDLNDDTNVILEWSYLSDRTLLEQFFEAEYDAGKDQETLIYGKYSPGPWAITGLVQPKIRDFLPQNQFLPRGDFYLLGKDLLGERLTYLTHSSVMYGTLDPPTQFGLPGDVEFNLGRLSTRHEFDLPTSLGPWQITPFVTGDFTGYTDTAQGGSLGRLYGAAGVRTTLPFYRIYSDVRSDLFNLHGLAHKIAFNADYLFARSNRTFNDLPLIDQLDDDTSELVRRQNILATFGGVLPRWYDPRFQALRRNILGYPEALDDNDQLRLSVTNRLQTKRGPIGGQRIIEWMYLDMGGSYFPNADRDNEGEAFGLLDYTYRWNIGDRTTITSDAIYEPFGDQFQANGAVTFQRPPRGTISFLFSHFTSGPFDSNYIGASTAYRFSSRYAGAIDIGQDLNTAQNVNVRASFSRIGLDFVTTVGIAWNAGRDDIGFDFSILPRVGARGRYGRSSIPTLPFGVEPAVQMLPSGAERAAILQQLSAN